MGWHDLCDEDTLDAIQYQHVSDEACLKAVVEAFLLREGSYQPSWRRLIHQLHEVGESHLAEKIKTNAEPQQGEWACIIPQQYMHNTSHMTSINPVFFPSAIYALTSLVPDPTLCKGKASGDTEHFLGLAHYHMIQYELCKVVT